MRFDQATIPLRPRSTANCLDLALVFARVHLRLVLTCWAIVAVPCCIGVYLAVDRWGATLNLAMVVFFLATSVLGTLITCGAAGAVFGEPLRLQHLRDPQTRRELIWLLLKVFVLRLATGVGLMFLLLPGIRIAVQWGFIVEQAALSRMSHHLHDRRVAKLLHGQLGDLAMRGLAISVFCGLLWGVLFLTLDQASGFLLGFPILLGRLPLGEGTMETYFESALDLEYYIVQGFLWSDPRVVTALLAVALLVYPLGRLAWFFCYIDLRVRRDCWDMELQMVQEAERLRGAV